MKIEEISKSDIGKVDDRELYSLRLRFLQVWKKHFEKKIEKLLVLDRNSIIEKYQILKKEMEARKLSYGIKELDKILFRKSIYKLDVPSLNEFVIVEDFISLAGDYVKNPKSIEKADIIIRSNEGQNDGLGEFASDIISDILKKECNVIWKMEGPETDYIPLFDIVLRPKTITKKVEISKPETTDKYHRIPVKDCKITATIDISEDKGIKALYCGGIKEIATYLFDVNKFTMAKAKEWVKIHKDDGLEKAETFNCECIKCGYKMTSKVHCNDLKCPKCEGQMRREERPGPGQKSTEKVAKSIKLFKMDNDRQIIGVVVYAPNEVDTQGDTANAEEIEKAAHKFNLGDKVFKIMHEGKAVDVDLLETYLMPADVKFGEVKVRKGSWFVVCKINDKKIWKKIKSGELEGISMGGEADRIFSLN
jgi:hypothetical protein